MELSPFDSDEALAQQVGQGDKAAFSTLYDRYAQPVYSLVVHMLGSPDAEEIVQDIFLRLWHKADQFDPARGSFVAWFMTMARHRILDKLRERTQQQRATIADDIDQLLLNAIDHSASIEDDIWLRQQGKAAVEAIQELPEEQRRVILLAYFGGLSQSAIAEQLDWPLGTVKKRLRLGLQKLRKALTQQGLAVNTQNRTPNQE